MPSRPGAHLQPIGTTQVSNNFCLIKFIIVISNLNLFFNQILDLFDFYKIINLIFFYYFIIFLLKYLFVLYIVSRS